MDQAELILKWRIGSAAAFQDSHDSHSVLCLVTHPLCSFTPGVLCLFSICFAFSFLFFYFILSLTRRNPVVSLNDKVKMAN